MHHARSCLTGRAAPTVDPLASDEGSDHDRAVPFFDPLPEPPSEVADLEAEREWSPPTWDRPSEGTLPAVLGVSLLFTRTEDAALALDHVRVFPNGFQLITTVMTNPRLPSALQMGGIHSIGLRAARTVPAGEPKIQPPAPLRQRPPFMMGPRLGVEFSNGQRAGAQARSPYDVAKDERGFPAAPIITSGGGGGGGGRYRWEHWVFPLPSPGQLVVFAEWSAIGIEESSVVLSADDIREAAQRASVLWS
jgi:hypothetical protein